MSYKLRKSTRKNGLMKVETLTFTGSTPEEYDDFLDARFERGDPLGFVTSANAPCGKLADGSFHWFSFARDVTEVQP